MLRDRAEGMAARELVELDRARSAGDCIVDEKGTALDVPEPDFVRLAREARQ